MNDTRPCRHWSDDCVRSICVRFFHSFQLQFVLPQDCLVLNCCTWWDRNSSPLLETDGTDKEARVFRERFDDNKPSGQCTKDVSAKCGNHTLREKERIENPLQTTCVNTEWNTARIGEAVITTKFKTQQEQVKQSKFKTPIFAFPFFQTELFTPIFSRKCKKKPPKFLHLPRVAPSAILSVALKFEDG